MTTMDREKAAREILAFYQEAGVDVALSEKPVDRFEDEPSHRREGARVEPPAAADIRAENPGKVQQPSRAADPPGVEAAARDRLARPAAPVSGPASVAAPYAVSSEAAVMAAREAARSAASLDELRTMLARFDGCPLKRTATQLVFADGNPKARVMFVGEAPGSDEDIQGVPFVGRSGKLLDLMMAAIGLDRKNVYIANIVPWRPPGNRTPTSQEIAMCLPFTLRQIELADPEILVCLGNPSTQTLLSLKEGITKTRGRWFKFHTGSREIRALPTLHPSYLLRQPSNKQLAWRDFLAVEKALRG
jgi:DNA polymerase